MVYKKHIRKNGKKFGPYYYESYRENGKVKTRFVGGPSLIDRFQERIEKNLTLIVMLLILIVFIGIIFFSSKYLSYSIEEKLYTGFLLENYYGLGCNNVKWVCEDWSSCVNGLKKRNCIYDNNCGSFIEEIICVNNEFTENEIPLNKKLLCNSISDCELTYGILNELGSGTKKMSCEFDGGIISIVNVPCEIKKEIFIEEINENKIIIYDSNTQEKIAGIDLNKYKGKSILDINWVFN